MISSVIQDSEESVGPLADGEVTRLLSALHNAEFTRSNKPNLAKDTRFKQRSLIEIAAEAKKLKETIEADQQSSDSDTDSDISKVENPLDAQSDSSNQENLEAAKKNEAALGQTVRDITSKQKMDDEAPQGEVGIRGLTTNSTSISETDGAEQGIRGLTTNSTSISETDETEQGIRGLTTKSTPISETDETEQGIRGLTTNSTSISETNETDQGIRGLTSVPHGEIDVPEKARALAELKSSQSGLDEKNAKNSFETVNEAYERGKTEGISEGRLTGVAETKERAMVDAKAELADIVDTFNNVLVSLARPKAMQVEALSSSVTKTILKLASQRAGIQIDELPEAFLDRINSLVSGVAQELAEGKVNLNEDDYATMKPYLDDLGFKVVVNSNLMRGDVTIQFDGVEVHDVAANRMASFSAVKLNQASDDNDASGDDAGLAKLLTGDELPPPSDEPGS